MNNTKRSSTRVSSLAARTLVDPKASAIQRSLAASVLRQTATNAQTGAAVEGKAARALDNPRSTNITKALAASLVSQSNKQR